MISAFAKGGAVLDGAHNAARYAEAARRAAEFVIGHMYGGRERQTAAALSRG